MTLTHQKKKKKRMKFDSHLKHHFHNVLASWGWKLYHASWDFWLQALDQISVHHQASLNIATYLLILGMASSPFQKHVAVRELGFGTLQSSSKGPVLPTHVVHPPPGSAYVLDGQAAAVAYVPDNSTMSWIDRFLPSW